MGYNESLYFKSNAIISDRICTYCTLSFFLDDSFGENIVCNSYLCLSLNYRLF